MKTKTLSFLGAPGSGKGTQARVLVDEYNFYHIATGDLIRAQRNLANTNPQAREITDRYDKGIPQPDTVVTELVLQKAQEHLSRPGIIFDPFPLSFGQAELLESWCVAHETKVLPTFLIYFIINEEESVKRLLLRAKTEDRADDKEEVVRYRYQQYVERADVLKKYYTERGRYIEVDGFPKAEEVTILMKQALKNAHILNA